MNPILPTQIVHKKVVVEVRSEGRLSVNANGRQFTVSTPLDSKKLQEKQHDLQKFFDGVFKENLELNGGNCNALELRLEDGHISVYRSNKNATSTPYEGDVEIFQNSDLISLFKPAINSEKSATIMKIEEKVTVFKKIMEMFKDLIHLIFGDTKVVNSEISTRLINEYQKYLSSLPISTQELIYRNINKISQDEIHFFKYLAEKVVPKDESLDMVQLYTEVLKGGYVVIDDGGKTFEDWYQHVQNKHTRLSSHQSDGNIQYTIQGWCVKECLFSKKMVTMADGSKKEVTWFQLERYPTRGKYAIPHLFSWVLYKLTNENQGPYGVSSHTEAHQPLEFKLRDDSTSRDYSHLVAK